MKLLILCIAVIAVSHQVAGLYIVISILLYWYTICTIGKPAMMSAESSDGTVTYKMQ
jgi:hypothetical protein